MRHATVAAILAFVMLSVIAIPLAASQNAAAATVTVNVSGHVDAGLTPADGVDILIGGIECGTTDENGVFDFDISKEPGEYRVRFEKKGYAVTAFVCNGILFDKDEPHMITVAEGGNVTMWANLVLADGTIRGAVTFNGRAVSGVTVEVRDLDSDVRTTKTTSDAGAYSIACPVGGNYSVSVTSPHYEAESKEVRELGIGGAVCDFELTAKSQATYLFELDFTHSMMLVAGIMGLFLLIFAISYRIHIGKHPETSKIHSDTKKKDRDQD